MHGQTYDYGSTGTEYQAWIDEGVIAWTADVQETRGWGVGVFVDSALDCGQECDVGAFQEGMPAIGSDAHDAGFAIHWCGVRRR